MRTAVDRIQDRLGAVLEEELNSCEDAREQQAAIEEAIKLCMGAWTLRYRYASPELKDKCLTTLTTFTGFVVATYRNALFHPDNMKGSRQ